MEERPCCCLSVVIFGLVFLTYGQLFYQSEALKSKFLPVVINTWGPPFTNATAEGMTSEFLYEYQPINKLYISLTYRHGTVLPYYMKFSRHVNFAI